MRGLTAIPAAIAMATPTVLTPASAQDRPTLSREFLTGTWSFDGTCASGWGMGLAADGEVWFDEWGQGLWVLEGDTIHMILQEFGGGFRGGPRRRGPVHAHRSGRQAGVHRPVRRQGRDDQRDQVRIAPVSRSPRPCCG